MSSHPSMDTLHAHRKLHHIVLQSNPITYRSFADAWKKTKFSFIHVSCRPEPDEQREMVTEAFQHVIGHMMIETHIQAQVCAVFTLHGLYHTQICQPKAKIRLTPKDFETINTLFHTCKDDQTGKYRTL